MPRPKKTDVPATTAQSLGALLKSARDIMRKDKGLNGDLDRLPMLTWIMFLKFLDDLEIQREGEAKLSGKKFKPAIEPPYRWRDWASKPDGITGDELLSFINNEDTVRPDGTKGPGLFRYLRTLTSSNGDNRRDVIATVFGGVQNRMISGYLLRDVVNKIAGINFTSSGELHTLSALYESMLREMRDAAGDSGEFYTPRAVVRFMVEVIDPRLGETVLDPASGTGGFLVEAYNHLAKQVKTTADHRILQDSSIYGGEPKPLPYLLCQMNLLLNGLDLPKIDPGNSLRHKLSDIGEKERVDIILTNPPFGGEEEKGIQGNFPEDKHTAETALLFLQLIMRKMRRRGGNARAAVVVPKGTLFGDGVCARIKKELLSEFNLHTIVRLPAGVFAPYTDQETAILFIDRTVARTKSVWYYQHPLPPDRAKLKNPCYRKSCPLRYEEFAPLMEWWGSRENTDCAWEVPIKEIADGGFNLDIRHPSQIGSAIVRTRDEVVEGIRTAFIQMQKAVANLSNTLLVSKTILPASAAVELITIENMGVEINSESRNPEKQPDREFVYVDLSCVYLNVIEGAQIIKGINAPSRARRVIRENDVLLSTVRPYLCGHAIVPETYNDQICSTGFSVLRCPESINPKYLYYMIISPQVIRQFHAYMRGSHYPALKDSHVRNIMIPNYNRTKQDDIVDKLDALTEQVQGSVTTIEAFTQRLDAEAKQALSSLVADVYGRISEGESHGEAH